MFLKRVKPNTMEVVFQNAAAELGFAPRILGVEKKTDYWTIGMEYVGDMSLADEFGTDPKNIPLWIWDEIRNMVRTLIKIGIEYRDITGYNFMKNGDKIYMVDFGDARMFVDNADWFVQEFLDGENSWNPDYK